MTSHALDSFHQLSPDEVLNTIETAGFECDGRLLALNSYENRVYRVGVISDSGESQNIVAKFYRPNRWSDAEILEEHAFSHELAELEIPVVAPLKRNRQTLFTNQHYRFALFNNKGGRAPDLEDLDQIEQLGRFMGRIHQAGCSENFKQRPELNIQTFGYTPKQFILEHEFLPKELIPAYESLTNQLLEEIEHCYERAGKPKLIRTHGDCHQGNILSTDQGFHIVDFDDARMAPAVQDLWMFLAGERSDMTASLDALLSGYTKFSEFDARELHLVEALRTLRLIHYYGWLAKRWDDPAFKHAFPWFNTQRCWEEHVLNLREQASLIHEQPLHWLG